ncbi:uncharacterized protein VTP21DRAFT_6260 [Calcarisporiella thermophila]|uniref:uncharacterized protein n=1 Tax=Calcarisporiella thermophila TaxID=911321 RepID=UPI0037429189
MGNGFSSLFIQRRSPSFSEPQSNVQCFTPCSQLCRFLFRGRIPSYLRPAKRNSRSLLRQVEEDKQNKRNAQPAVTSTVTTNQRSFNLKFREGRSYTEGQTYLFPVDKEEAARLIDEYYTLRAAFQCLYFVPIEEGLKSGLRVLDIGCGPGLWALQMASDYPNSEFIGIDVQSMMFPQELWPDLRMPSNLKFELVDILRGPLPYPDATFDFVHQRLMNLAIPKRQWPDVIKELKRVTKPGGWIQLLEADIEPHPQGVTNKQLSYKIFHAIMARGIDPHISRRIDRLLADSQISDLESFIIATPIGDWGRDIGRMLKNDGMKAMSTWRPWLCQATDTPTDEFDAMVKEVEREWEENKSNVHFHVAYGRRPLEEAITSSSGGITVDFEPGQVD